VLIHHACVYKWITWLKRCCINAAASSKKPAIMKTVLSETVLMLARTETTMMLSGILKML